MKLEDSLTPYTNINLKWIKGLSLRLDTIKLLEENTGRTFFDISLSSIFLDSKGSTYYSDENKTKINKWDLINLKAFAQQRKP